MKLSKYAYETLSLKEGSLSLYKTLEKSLVGMRALLGRRMLSLGMENAPAPP